MEKTMKLLYVVHRYAPYPGGSEIYVQGMAEESLKRGHQVAVFAGEHQGNYNGVTVTSNVNILLEKWDMIIIHGGDVHVQNFVLQNAKLISSPILYMLILPSKSQICIQALYDCAYIGCSTNQDWNHCEEYNVKNKAIRIRHGITKENCIGQSGFKQKYNIAKKMFLSCGGYWPNKAMKELAYIFEKCNLDDSVLVTTGYDNRMNLMPNKTKNVLSLLLDDRDDLLSAIKDADCVLMHSYQEGFGLVLLESMLNHTPWIARNIAGANLMKSYGQVYDTDQELMNKIQNFDAKSFDLDKAYEYVCSNHLISNTIDDIETCVYHNNGVI
jgi:glycosyltransferase involved in cell wall biosynthesis